MPFMEPKLFITISFHFNNRLSLGPVPSLMHLVLTFVGNVTVLESQRVPGGQGFQISRQLAHEGGMVVSLLHLPT